MEKKHPYLIVGLGNPGREYENNRHNVGFLTLERLAVRLGEAFTREKMNALITTGKLDGSQLILAKPQTFMNDSGSAVSSLQRFYQVPLENLLVIYDDVDLPFDHLRLRTEGGAGGQKGVRSIIRALGTNKFPRLRIGIGRPPGRMSVSEYVLQDFTNQESQLLDFILETAVDAVLLYIKEGIHQAMTEYNQSPD